MTAERWRTHAEILAVLARFEGLVTGYVPPAAYAIGLLPAVPRSAAEVFPMVSDGGRRLPASVLATVCGHVRGTATYRLTRAQLSDAIERLAPAEACTDYDHPNLVAWRAVAARAEQRTDAVIVAVFVQHRADSLWASPMS